MSRKVIRNYFRAAFQRRSKERLRDGLKSLSLYCQQPQQPQQGRKTPVDLEEAMKLLTFWPSADLLDAISSSVETLAMCDREKPQYPLWKAVNYVDRRFTSYRLVSRLDALAIRARKLLEQDGLSELEKVHCVSQGHGQKASRAKAFLRDYENVRSDLRAAAKVKWESYQELLIHPSSKSYLASGFNGPVPITCYARTLELIIEDQYRQITRDKARPYLMWIARLGNPQYQDLLEHDDFAKITREWNERRTAEQQRQHTKSRAAERSRRFRRKKSVAKALRPS
jgi:hypothetical protein